MYRAPKPPTKKSYYRYSNPKMYSLANIWRTQTKKGIISEKNTEIETKTSSKKFPAESCTTVKSTQYCMVNIMNAYETTYIAVANRRPPTNQAAD